MEKTRCESFHLRTDEISRLKEMHRLGDPLPNPHNPGVYYWIIETFKEMGLNRFHTLTLFSSNLQRRLQDAETIQADGTTAWDRMERNAGKILVYLAVLQNAAYGLKLFQVGQLVLDTRGCAINVVRDREEIMVELNTDAITPRKLVK